MRILIVTDAWSPQVNGVVTTVRNTVRERKQCNTAKELVWCDKPRKHDQRDHFDPHQNFSP